MEFTDEIEIAGSMEEALKDIFETYEEGQKIIEEQPIIIDASQIKDGPIISKIKKIQQALKDLAKIDVTISIKGKASPVKPISETLSDVLGKFHSMAKEISAMSMETVIGFNQVASAGVNGAVAPRTNTAVPGRSNFDASSSGDTTTVMFDFGKGRVVGPVTAPRNVKDELIVELNRAKRTI